MLSAEAIKVRSFESVRRMSLRGSRRRPLIFAVEDPDWIDRSSEEYLSSLVEDLAGAAIPLLATYRPTRIPTMLQASETASNAQPQSLSLPRVWRPSPARLSRKI